MTATVIHLVRTPTNYVLHMTVGKGPARVLPNVQRLAL